MVGAGEKNNFLPPKPIPDFFWSALHNIQTSGNWRIEFKENLMGIKGSPVKTWNYVHVRPCMCFHVSICLITFFRMKCFHMSLESARSLNVFEATLPEWLDDLTCFCFLIIILIYRYDMYIKSCRIWPGWNSSPGKPLGMVVAQGASWPTCGTSLAWLILGETKILPRWGWEW